MNDTEALRLENVSLHFASTGREVLKNICWTIHRGERWVLFGGNGAGKTKLLEIMAGYVHPSAGTVSRLGMERCDLRDLRKHIGFVGTGLREAFPPRETALDVVLSGIDATIGLYREPASDEIGAARGLFVHGGVAHLESARFGTLSEGEKQRILMLRAALCGPEILVLDEPAEGLDLAAREDLMVTVAGLSGERDAAVVYVTHHVEEITPLFTKLFMLHGGRELYSGDMNGGMTAANLTRVFGRAVEMERRHGRYYAFAASRS